MDVVLLLATAAVAFVGGVLLKDYFPAYAKAKATNLATKEDIAEITRHVEGVRAAITSESALIERRRDVYARMANAMRIFIAGHGSTQEQRQDFHGAYSACWLWAPDEVLSALNTFIRMQQEYSSGVHVHDQAELKRAFVKVMLRMRKHVGFPQSEIDEQGYVFVQFADPPPNPSERTRHA